MAGTLENIDIQAFVVDFVSDAERSSAELPRLTTGQRKYAKRLLEQYPEIMCESYGLGQERRLNLFKVMGKSNRPAPQPCIDGFVAMEKPPSTPCKNEVKCVMDGPVCKLDLMSIKDAKLLVADDRSTATPSSPCLSDASPASTFREVLPWFRLPPGLELEVHNTFIHYKSTPSSQRAVQSMPHCMFRQCLLAESLNNQPEKVDVSNASAPGISTPQASPLEMCGGSLTAGTEVVIEGLSKCPAFNGLKGAIQYLDEQSGRYNILLSSPVNGHKTVKVKRGNFRLVSATESLHLFQDHTGAPRPLRLTGLV